MTITVPVYCTREEVMSSFDVRLSSSRIAQVDRAIVAATDSVEGLLHRTFYPNDDTRSFDWPNFQRSYPWKIYLDQNELADVTVNVPVVKSGGTVIPANQILWGPWNYAPPYTKIELDRSTSASFGLGNTPQKDVTIQGTFGYWLKWDSAGALAAAISSTTATSITVTDGTPLGVGSLILIDSERILLSDRNFVDSTDTVSGTGVNTASASDKSLAVSAGTFYAGEIIRIDSEQMLITDTTATGYIVLRAYNGSVLGTHTAGTAIYVDRGFTVIRGMLGTTAATHSNAAAITVFRYPGDVKELCLAEASNDFQQEIAAYARQIASSDSALGGGTSVRAKAMGFTGLQDLRDRTFATFGRKARRRVI